MSLTFDLVDEKLKVLEYLTSNMKQIQDDVLEEILTFNANTKYLHHFLRERFDKEIFKRNVPVITYEDIEPYLERVLSGESSDDIISAQPITSFLISSLTDSRGAPKIMPCNDKYMENLAFINDLRMHILSKHVKGVEEGKGLMFLFTELEFNTLGIPAQDTTSNYLKSDYFKNRPLNWYYSYSSPDEVILCPDSKQSLYCHLLCGLVQRNEIVRIGSNFPSVLIRAVKFLGEFWKELCLNIQTGHLSKWITDLDCRNSVSMILEGPRPELANTIRIICSQKSWKGIITKLWPKTKYIEAVLTGTMVEQYVSSLRYFCNNIPIITTTYSETTFGINLDPLCKPDDVSYTFMPNMSYFEFIPMEGDNENEVVDLADVKFGCFYEPVVTNFSGLYRVRMEDVVLVTGFYNKAPQFKFFDKSKKGELIKKKLIAKKNTRKTKE